MRVYTHPLSIAHMNFPSRKSIKRNRGILPLPHASPLLAGVLGGGGVPPPPLFPGVSVWRVKCTFYGWMGQWEGSMRAKILGKWV